MLAHTEVKVRAGENKKVERGYFGTISCELSWKLPQLETDPQRQGVNERNGAAALGSLLSSGGSTNFSRAC